MRRAVGWILSEADRTSLLQRFVPRYNEVIAHHVTLWGRAANAAVPPPAKFCVVGHADAGDGIEALVVTVDGAMKRPDGSLFHVTWSLDPASGKVPKDSNTLIAAHGWDALEPIPFAAEPGRVG